jgi:hypothetical protein
MAYYDTINLVQGDDLPQLEIILRDSSAAATGQTLDIGDPTTWNPIDLTNATAVRLKYRRINTVTLVDTLTFTIVSPATDGKIIVAWGATTLDDGVGDYEGEIEIQYSNGTYLTVPDKLKFSVRAGF